jgi:hypothetical protein
VLSKLQEGLQSTQNTVPYVQAMERIVFPLQVSLTVEPAARALTILVTAEESEQE